MDIDGGKEDGIMTCWVSILVVKMVYERGIVVMREITRGVGDETK